MPDDLAEACYLWLGLNSLEQVQPNSIGQLIALVSNNVIPEQQKAVTQEKQFVKIFTDGTDALRKRWQHPLTEYQRYNHQRICLRVFYRSVRAYSYLAPAQAHTVPASVISDGLGPIQGECWLGINYKQFLVFRTYSQFKPTVKISLEDLKITHTTFSLFIEVNYYEGLAQSNQDLSPSMRNLSE